jgi:hypothetical protein
VHGLPKAAPSTSNADAPVRLAVPLSAPSTSNADAPVRLAVPLSARNKPTPAAIQVLAGPCAWIPLALEHPARVLWRIDPEPSALKLGEFPYGVAPVGYRTTVPASPLSEGCYCVRVEPCCDAQAEMEVRAGVGRESCERWPTADMPLPESELSAYEFRKAGREERAWDVHGRGVDVYAIKNSARSGSPLAHLAVSLIPWKEAPKTAFQALEGQPPTDAVRASRLVLEDASRTQHETYVRWIGDRQNLEAAMLVRRSTEHRVTLLMLDKQIHANGIRGVLAHSLGDIDGDGLSDLALLREPFLDDHERPIDLDVDVYLTLGGQGLHQVKLTSTDQVFALGARCRTRATDKDYPFVRNNWQVATPAVGQILAKFTPPSRCGGREWAIELQDGAFRVTQRNAP